jgi:hypothetical protein
MIFGSLSLLPQPAAVKEAESFSPLSYEKKWKRSSIGTKATAARPVAIAKNSSMRSSNFTAFAIFRFGHRFACLRSTLQTHGITGRPNSHRARVPTRFSGRGP